MSESAPTYLADPAGHYSTEDTARTHLHSELDRRATCQRCATAINQLGLIKLDLDAIHAELTLLRTQAARLGGVVPSAVANIQARLDWLTTRQQIALLAIGGVERIWADPATAPEPAWSCTIHVSCPHCGNSYDQEHAHSSIWSMPHKCGACGSRRVSMTYAKASA